MEERVGGMMDGEREEEREVKDGKRGDEDGENGRGEEGGCQRQRKMVGREEERVR